jgi:hypothetical protein
MIRIWSHWFSTTLIKVIRIAATGRERSDETADQKKVGAFDAELAGAHSTEKNIFFKCF